MLILRTAALAALVILPCAGCRTPNPDQAEPDAEVVADAGPTVDAPFVPLDDAGKPLFDIKAPFDRPKGKDVPVQPNERGVFPEAFVPPDLPIANAIKVAAVQYGPGLYSFAPGCTNDVCAISHFITEAKKAGASHVVTPEYGIGQKYLEPSPTLGAKPGQDAAFSQTVIMKPLSALADSLDITIVFNLITSDGSGSTAPQYNTEVVVDGNGVVIARHFKYYLFGETGLTPGTSCCDLFQTPVGQAGLLICADINCIVDLKAVGNCTNTALNLMNSYAAKKTYLTFFSSFWASTGSLDPYWQPNQVQSKFAKHASTFMVAANIIANDYHGGGVYRPDGSPISIVNTTTPGIAYGVIPKQGTVIPNPPPPAAKVVITELMINPSAVADADGEWIELYNAGSGAVDLTGWSVRDGTTGMADWLTSYQLAPGEYVTVGAGTNKAKNGGVASVSAWNSFGLANTKGTVKLHDAAGNLADEVIYGAGFPLPTGASISLKSPGLDNSQGASWCAEKTAWSGSAGDKGTPGAAAGCP